MSGKFSWYSAVLLWLIFSSCGKDLPALDDLDIVSWKSDKNACLGKRSGMVESLQAQKDKLLALSEVQIVQLLGRPDKNELYKRNQKFYSYFVQPAEACNVSEVENPYRLVIRFNAVGLSKEVSVEN